MMRCITCAEQSATPRCQSCTDTLVATTLRTRIAEGASVLLRVGVPENLADARHDDYEWVGVDGGVALHGPPGHGKSRKAAGLVRRRLWQLAKLAGPDVREWWTVDGGVRFVRVDALLQQLRDDAFGRGTTDEAGAVQAWGRTGWLVLDDLGAEKRSEWVGQTLHSLLSHRESGALTTIVTTNYSPDDLQEMYAGWGPPIVSRLHALCRWLKLLDKDWRRT
jgi:DNA replication protein DnaC